MKTIFLKDSEILRSWYVIDAENKPLGRVAAKVASILRGKHKNIFAPHQEIGDFVIVLNAGKVSVSGNKEKDKMYHRHTGYVGGLRSVNFAQLIEKKPEQPMLLAVKGMLPKGPLGRQLMRNVKVYAGTDHPHTAQNPIKLEF